MPVFGVQASGAMPVILPEEKALYGYGTGLTGRPDIYRPLTGNPADGYLDALGLSCASWNRFSTTEARTLHVRSSERLARRLGLTSPMSAEQADTIRAAIDARCNPGVVGTIAPGVFGTSFDRCAAWALMDYDARIRAATAHLEHLGASFTNIYAAAASYVNSDPYPAFVAPGLFLSNTADELVVAITSACNQRSMAGASGPPGPGAHGMSGPGVGTKFSYVMAKPSGAITDSPALPWLGGAAIGSLITFFAMRKSKKG